MKDYDIYLFDFDGTLVNSFEALTYVFVSAFKTVGYSINPKEVFPLSRESLKNGYLRLVGDLTNFDHYKDQIGLLLKDDYSLEHTYLYEEVVETLKVLKTKNKKIGIVTSNSTCHVEKLLNKLGISNYFDVIVGHELYKKSKPDCEPILKALEHFINVDKTKVVYIGDGYNDMLSSLASEIDGVFIARDDNKIMDKRFKIINSLLELI